MSVELHLQDMHAAELAKLIRDDLRYRHGNKKSSKVLRDIAAEIRQQLRCSCGGEDSDGRGDVLRCPIHCPGITPLRQ